MRSEYPYKRRQAAPRNARYAEKGVWPLRYPLRFNSRSSGQMARRMITGAEADACPAIFCAADDGFSIMQVKGWPESRNKAAASAESRPPPMVSKLRRGNSPRYASYWAVSSFDVILTNPSAVK